MENWVEIVFVKEGLSTSLFEDPVHTLQTAVARWKKPCSQRALVRKRMRDMELLIDLETKREKLMSSKLLSQSNTRIRDVHLQYHKLRKNPLATCMFPSAMEYDEETAFRRIVFRVNNWVDIQWDMYEEAIHQVSIQARIVDTCDEDILTAGIEEAIELMKMLIE